MGNVTATLNLPHWVDEELAERGFIPPDEIRALTLTNVLGDTGTRLCLPANVIQQLGLKRAGEVDVKTALGPSTL